MIGFLRFVGILNAAIWFGAAFYFTVGVAPVSSSADLQKVLSPQNYPYFGGAIAQVFITRYFRLNIICSIIALLHLMAEWIYLGRYPHRLRLGLLLTLFSLSLVSAYGVQPWLRQLHLIRYGANALPANREAASRSFRAWQMISEGINLFLLVGAGVYFWGVTNPPDPTRFASTAKFRS